MRKLFVVLLFILAFQCKAEALIYIDETYTGLKAVKHADTGYGPYFGDSSGGGALAGPVGNAHTQLRASQFTIEQPAIVNYLSINAVLHPSLRLYDELVSPYIHQRLAEGATSEQIGLEINGDGVNPPLFVGPAQSIDVNFALIKGSRVYGTDIGYSDRETMPSSNILANAHYTFFTDNSRYDKQYPNLLIPFSPFSSELTPTDDYWILASSDHTGIDFRYSTKLVGEVNTPEPATMLLMGGGLAGMLWRRRRVSKA